MASDTPCYNAAVETLRDEEYPMLRDAIYLDHAGTTPYPKSLMDRFARDMQSNLFGNPHSASSSSQLSTARIEDVRLRVLQWFNADPAHFDVVFVANATAGIKLVVEALRSQPGGFSYMYHLPSHTSLVGVREEAHSSNCFSHPGAVRPPARDEFSDQKCGGDGGVTLVAYPAQSNMDGERFPLDWPSVFRERWSRSNGDVYTLLDAASLVATSPLDLGDPELAPDFTALSFYKIFGFPDLGALIVRRQAESVFRSRKFFGGGTVDMVVSQREQWHAPKSQFLHERLEDGTLPVHSIIALDSAMDVHLKLFGPISRVSSHCSYLARRLYEGLDSLRHANGKRVCVLYSRRAGDADASRDAHSYGPVVAFNIRTSLDAWVPLTEFEKLAALKKFHVRTGSVCNPGGIASALGLEPWEMKKNFSSGFRCGADNDVMGGKPTGVIRVSLGAMSTISDVDQFVTFIDEFYQERNEPADAVQSTALFPPPVELSVRSITVYPIKSCGGFQITKGVEWEVRPEGLAWDREWCLLHRGTGQALSQKRYPEMALIRPTLDFKGGRLRVDFKGESPAHTPKTIFIPLSDDPTVLEPVAAPPSMVSRVCGDEISAQRYASLEVNDFFSEALGVSCALARFPPGGEGKGMRHAKAHLQRHNMQMNTRRAVRPDMFSEPQSPPDSDTENAQRRILLSNESPILLVNTSSLASLNRDIALAGAEEIVAAAFRANVVVGPANSGFENSPRQQQQQQRLSSYEEDNWAGVRIGQQEFKTLGPCRRCHMVCINQDTGARSEEPFVTLSKTRRFGGKVFFGVHMAHTRPHADSRRRETQFPTIRVGDAVWPDLGDEV